MPLTIAHPAAVLPFRKWLVLSALVVGSMAPDFEYFLYIPAAQRVGHTLSGIFLFCLPAGLVALCLYDFVMKGPLVLLTPAGFQKRLPEGGGAFRLGPPIRFAAIVASLLVGTATHLAWDAFTHPDGWVVLRLPLLSETACTVFGRAIPVYSLLQHGSTAAGLSILVMMLLHWYRHAALHVRKIDWTPHVLLVPVLVLLPAVIGCSHAGLESLRHGFSYQVFAGCAVTAFLAALASELFLFSIAVQLFRRASPD